MRAIGFDLGRTLVGYENIQLSWKSLYKEALNDVLLQCDCIVDDTKIAAGEDILSKYNTRINYREIEVCSDVIFSEILENWGLHVEKYLAASKKAFFKYFQQNAVVYEDTISTLRVLKEKGIRTGILTDVPYGMDMEHVLEDIEMFKEYIDILLTSVQVGFRKPNSQAFMILADSLGVEPSDMIYVGDEQKDIVGANNIGMYSVLVNRTDDNIDYGQKKTLSRLSDILEMI